MLLKVVYWVSTAIVLFLLSWAAVMYHVSYDGVSTYFGVLGYPAYLVYPLAWLKIIAIVVIVTHRYNDLRDMVYAAYLLNMVVALAAHLVQGDGFAHAAAGLVALPVSYLLGFKVRGTPPKRFFSRLVD